MMVDVEKSMSTITGHLGELRLTDKYRGINFMPTIEEKKFNFVDEYVFLVL